MSFIGPAAQPDSGGAGNPRRRTRLGGDALLEELERVSSHPEPYVFSYPGRAEVEVLAHFCDDPVPHVLYTTFGLSRVRSTVPVAEVQTELSLRTAAASPLPLNWPADALAALALHIRRSGRDLEPGHYLELTPPHMGGVAGFSFVADPILRKVDTPTGPVVYTYAVGLTSRDLEDALCWDPVRFTGLLGERFPLGLTDPARGPLRREPGYAERIEGAIRREGSSISAVEVKFLDVEPGRIDVDPRGAKALLRAARGRLAFGRPFALVREKGSEDWVRFSPDAGDTDPREVRATATLADELLATFDTTPGAYPLRSRDLTIHVIDPER